MSSIPKKKTVHEKLDELISLRSGDATAFRAMAMKLDNLENLTLAMLTTNAALVDKLHDDGYLDDISYRKIKDAS